MFISISDIERKNVIMNTFGGGYEYQYYNTMYGPEYIESMATKKLTKIDKTKTKEYNDINTNLNKIIKEIDVYKNSLELYIKDIGRKLKDIDRSNSANSIEDYNNTYKNMSEFMKKKLDAITTKGTFVTKKYDLLQKQQKLDNDTGKGNGDKTQGLYKTPSANFLEILKQPTIPQQPTLADICKNVPTDESVNTSSYNMSSADKYSVDSIKHQNSLEEFYVINPDNGFGYIRYRTPDGDEGIKPMTVRQFDTSTPNWSTMTITDRSSIVYPIVEDRNLPAEIVAEWSKYFEDKNILGVKG